MSALMSEEDLRILREFLIDESAPDNYIEWLDQQLRVREAQRTRSGTSHHRDLMDAYRSAVAEWEAYREAHGNGYPAETADYERDHPRPTLKDFMRDHRPASTPVTCPACGVRFNLEDVN